LADSERIARKLEMSGYEKTAKPEEAGLIVINACSVRQSAVNRAHGKIRELRIKNKELKIILAGCVLETDKKKLKDKIDEFWHPDEYFDLIPIGSGSNTAHIPIMTGCDNFCAYCAVPYTRGRERSRPAENIIKDVKIALKNNKKEIWLLGQNVNSYKYDFPKLLKTINDIDGDFKIYFVSSHPKDFSDNLIKTISESEKVSREIHLPVQSGDNAVLKKMNRKYTIGHYKNLIKKIRKAVPDVKISTDVIVGFPEETEKQFQNTVKLFKEMKFSKAYIGKYSPRPGTPAAKMKDSVPIEEKKRRWKILNEIANQKNKIIVILGQTASGKSELAVKLAKKLNGEVISADSRQVYKGLDIGTAKVNGTWNAKRGTRKFIYKKVPHHCIDIVSPKKIFTALDFKKCAEKAIKDIESRGKTPIICGGTGFYIDILLDRMKIAEVAPNWELRKKLKKMPVEKLFKMLKKLNPSRAKNIDAKNPRRLIRAIEIAKIKPSAVSRQSPKTESQKMKAESYAFIGIKLPEKELQKRIEKRIKKMLRDGLIREVKKLRKQNISWKRLYELGFEYKYPAMFLQGKISKKEMLKRMILENRQYAKRQMTWFKKNKDIKWIGGR